jgi:nucleoside-diphosphate-sugar epimerase
MKIVITGSIGNIGKPLTQELVQKGIQLLLLAAKPLHTYLNSKGYDKIDEQYNDKDFGSRYILWSNHQKSYPTNMGW